MTPAPIQFVPGLLENDPTKLRVRYNDHQVSAPTPPPSADWTVGVPSWGMLANDRVGDCTAAGAAHIQMAIEHCGRGRNVEFGDADALAMYSGVTGYSPTRPGSDTGASLQDSLDWWRTHGIGGYRIDGFAQLTLDDVAVMQECIATFGAVYAGMEFPSTAMTQFNAGRLWTVRGGARKEGGHCVPLLGYDHNGPWGVTWDRVQAMDWQFFRRYFTELWVPISRDWLSLTGRSPSGLDVGSLNRSYMALTGEPGPFPHPSQHR